MKRTGLLNAALAAEVARLGHTHEVVVADCGLPLPRGGPAVVDLAVVAGVPSFESVLRALLAEVVIEGGIAAAEVTGANPACAGLLRELVAPLDLVPHEDLKRRVAGARLVVRTGEARPFANVVLRCGVPF